MGTVFSDSQAEIYYVSKAKRFRGGDDSSVSPNRRLPPDSSDSVSRDYKAGFQPGQSKVQYQGRSDPEFRRKNPPFFHAKPQLRFNTERGARGLSFLSAKPVEVLRRLQALPKVKFCLDRQTRKEVLFAKGRAGYSGSAGKKFWKRKASSQWRCR